MPDPTTNTKGFHIIQSISKLVQKSFGATVGEGVVGDIENPGFEACMRLLSASGAPLTLMLALPKGDLPGIALSREQEERRSSRWKTTYIP